MTFVLCVLFFVLGLACGGFAMWLQMSVDVVGNLNLESFDE